MRLSVGTTALAAQGGDVMKHLKNPTRAQKKLMSKWKLDWRDWLVEREMPTQLVLIHRHFDYKTKIIPKGGKDE